MAVGILHPQAVVCLQGGSGPDRSTFLRRSHGSRIHSGTHLAGSTFTDIRWAERDRSSLPPKVLLSPVTDAKFPSHQQTPQEVPYSSVALPSSMKYIRSSAGWIAHRGGGSAGRDREFAIPRHALELIRVLSATPVYNGSRGHKCRQPVIHSWNGSRSILTCGLGSRAFAVTGSPFRRFWIGSPVGHPSSKSWRIIPRSNRMTSLPCMLTPPNWRRGAKSPGDEAPLRRKPVAEADSIIARPFPRVRARAPQRAGSYRRSEDSGLRCRSRLDPGLDG